MVRTLGRIIVIIILLAAGVWLVAGRRGPAPEGGARLAALQSLGAGAPGRPTGPVSDEPVPASGVMTATSVDLAVVPAGVSADSTQHALWLRGEIDLYENESLVPPAELAALQEAARRLPASDRVQSASATGPALAAPTFDSAGFDSLQYGGWVPPDPELAVGTNHIIAVVNSSFAIYNKSGGVIVAPTGFSNLFSAAGCTGTLFDPNVLYDEEAGRFIMAVDGNGTHYCIAASKTGNPAGSWWLYRLPAASGSEFFDYPHAGIGQDHLLLGANIFNPGFLESRIYAIDKAQLYAGAAVSFAMKKLPNTQDTPQPLHLHGFGQGTWPAGAHNYFFTGDGFNGQTYSVWRWNNPLGGGTPAKVGTVDLEAYTGVSAGYPVNVPQSGSTARLQANDFRPHDFEYRNGFAWSTQTIACNPGGGTVDCIRWAKIDPATAAVVDAGVYASGGEYRFFPNLAVNHCGDMAIGYTKSSAAMFPSIFITGRRSADPPGTLQPEVQMRAGTLAYTAFDPPPHRWGDYTGMTIDPDGLRFWYLGQYSKNTGITNGRWGTFIRSFSFDDCTANGGESPASFEISTLKAGKVGGVAYTPGDILRYEAGTGAWSLPFDASDVGLGGNLSAYYREDLPGLDNLYLSFAANVTIPGLGTVTPWDVVVFTPTQLGPDTAGTFSWHFDGSDVGLTTSGEKIDALGRDGSGRLLISVTGAGNVPGVGKFADEDVVAFTPTSLGQNTAGTWSPYFDGSAAVAGLAAEDVNGFWDDPASDDLYITILGAFNLGGVTGSGKSIVRLAPAGGGSYAPSIVWDGAAAGFPSNLDALEMTVEE